MIQSLRRNTWLLNLVSRLSSVKNYLFANFCLILCCSDDASGKALSELMQKYKTLNSETILNNSSSEKSNIDKEQIEKAPNLFIEPCPFEIQDPAIQLFLDNINMWQSALYPRSKEAKLQFFDLLHRFKSIYCKWSGDDLMDMDEKQLNSLDASLQVVGHPKEFLELVSDYFTVVCFQFRLGLFHFFVSCK